MIYEKRAIVQKLFKVKLVGNGVNYFCRIITSLGNVEKVKYPLSHLSIVAGL